jgi:hypothetical protein
VGESGYFFYREGSRELPLYWEYGGGDVVVAVRADEPSKFTARHPWIVGREREILERVVGEVVRVGHRPVELRSTRRPFPFMYASRIRRPGASLRATLEAATALS